MQAELIDHITYRDGYIEGRNAVDEETVVEIDDNEIVEENLRGWGTANAVVFFQGAHYLARIIAA